MKILDFGLAKIKSGELLGSFIQAQTTGLMGSPYYMAPEQWADEEPDARSDIYSLGVMLFQMLTGDVPFKGGSIPAIMKKHLDDQPPAFSVLGLDIPPEVEAVVRHSLEKGRDKRTPSVEALIEELRNAITPSQNQIHTISGGAGVLPVSSLHVRTRPPQSRVFLNNTSVGESETDGSLLLEGIQSGNHHLRVTHEGFNDWENQIVCDGSPREVVAELSKPANPLETMRVPQPTHIPLAAFENETVVSRQPHVIDLQETARDEFGDEKRGVTPFLLYGGIAAGVILLSVFGIGIYWAFFSNGGVTGNTNQPANRALTNGNGTVPPAALKAELAMITGGKFKMGRNDGPVIEQPSHEIEVKDFWMDKTEVTNREYEQFVSETGYRAPQHWVDGKPLEGQEMMPVIFVSLEDANAFAAWRSKRDGVQYRLPTEQEWEYAARNGDQEYLFPWGNKWEEGKSVIDQPNVKAAGSEPGDKNKWGVLDLIGNVAEWTGTELKPYPGSQLVPLKTDKTQAVRGGTYKSKASGAGAITATSRFIDTPGKRNETLGFRLVRPL